MSLCCPLGPPGVPEGSRGVLYGPLGFPRCSHRVGDPPGSPWASPRGPLRSTGGPRGPRGVARGPLGVISRHAGGPLRIPGDPLEVPRLSRVSHGCHMGVPGGSRESCGNTRDTRNGFLDGTSATTRARSTPIRTVCRSATHEPNANPHGIATSSARDPFKDTACLKPFRHFSLKYRNVSAKSGMFGIRCSICVECL